MKCFEVNGVHTTPFIMVGRLHFVRVGNINVPLDKTLVDKIPAFGRLKLTDAQVGATADKPTSILPTDCIATDGAPVLVKVTLPLATRSKLKVSGTAKVWHGERYDEHVVAGGPYPAIPVMVRFENYQALLTMAPGQTFTIDQSFETEEYPGFFQMLRGVKPTTRTVNRRYTVSFDGTDIRVDDSAA